MEETYIPGMNGVNAKGPSASAPAGTVPASESSEVSARTQGTPVVGFLYSVSKDGFPKYWPLYVGKNRVGKAAEMDICLREATVSDHHADINIKILRRKNGTPVASIKDAGSKTGIEVNNEELAYEDHELVDGDKITIGLNYKFLLILIDPNKHGLAKEEGFEPLDEVESKLPLDETFNTVVSSPYAPNPNETVNISGPSLGDINAGSTRIM